MLGLSLGLYIGAQGGGATVPMLDKLAPADYSAAVGAWSFRRLRAAYAGPLIRIRRTSDDVEQDFTGATTVSATEIATFLGASSGAVVRIYDQVGANNLTQSTKTSQPIYIATGIAGAKPAGDFNGTSHNLGANGVAASFTGGNRPITALTVMSPDTTTGAQTAWGLGHTVSWTQFVAHDMTSAEWRYVKKDDLSVITSTFFAAAAAGDFVTLVRHSGSAVRASLGIGGRGLAVPQAAASSAAATFDRYTVGALGRPGLSNYFDGKLTEHVVFSADLSDSAANTVMADVQSYYGVVCPTVYNLSASAAQQLPDGLGAAPGTGFTCTGLADDTAADAWLCANDGRANDTDVTYTPSLLRVSRDGSTKINEIDLGTLYPAMMSVQGVAVDTTDGTIWLASPNENLIRHVSTSGVSIGSLAKTSPNGMCYDSRRDRLWYTGPSSTLYRVAKDGTQEYSFSITRLSSVDHLFYDAARDLIWITSGSNSNIGTVCSFNPSNGLIGGTNYCLNNSLAIEGVVVKSGNIYVLNDAYFHNVSPHQNLLQTYAVS